MYRAHRAWRSTRSATRRASSVISTPTAEVAHSLCENYVITGFSEVDMTEREVRTMRSFCRICTAVCGILVDVSGDEVVRVRGDKDHPFSHGYTCPKGRALPQMHHHPERLERPLIRIGDRQQPTTWDACLDDLGSRLRAIVDRHGP